MPNDHDEALSSDAMILYAAAVAGAPHGFGRRASGDGIAHAFAAYADWTDERMEAAVKELQRHDLIDVVTA